jgi:HD-GYP domain-containing protein (c-di-GMP phosphodiesterase class II)
LRGDEIPVAAAIVSVADALDAMTHDRPYRTGRSIDWAISEIEAGTGTQFSPRVVEALVRTHLRGALPPAHGLDGELREAA